MTRGPAAALLKALVSVVTMAVGISSPNLLQHGSYRLR